MKYSSIISWSIIGSVLITQAFAWGGYMANTSNVNLLNGQSDIQTTSVPDEYVPLPGSTPTYTFDEKAVKIENAALYKVTCDMTEVWKDAGVGSNTKLTAIEYKNGDYIFRGDSRGCNFSASLDGGSQLDGKKMPGITTEEALRKAGEFMQTYKIANFTFPLGQATVTSVATEGPIAYAMSEKRIADAPADTNKTWTGITKYQSVTVNYPIVVNGKKIYGQWGEPIGVSITVDGKGSVNYMSATPKFSLKKRSSDLASTEDVIRFVKNGGSSPYYREVPSNNSESDNVELDKIERTLVWFNYYNKGLSDIYISTATRLSSTKTKAPYALGQYSQIVSDYKIGNINMR